MRQFGRVQKIPMAPIPPVSTHTKRGKTSTTYTRVRYHFLESIWQNWIHHVIAEGHRSIPLSQSLLSCADDYVDWYRDHCVLRVQNPANLPANIVVGASHFQPTYDQLYSVSLFFKPIIRFKNFSDFSITFLTFSLYFVFC